MIRIARFVLVSALFAGGRAWADSTPWADGRFAYRQEVDIAPVVTRLPGDDVGVVAFHTFGLLNLESPNIQVVSRAGHKVPHYVMSTGPGDQIRLAFALSGSANRYHVYFNDQKAPPPKDPAAQWLPKRGVLMEARRYRGGEANGLAEAKKTFEAARPVVGRTFVPNIFLAYNPFGPPGNTCYRYTGELLIEQDGEYTLALSSWDASFLLADGELVLQWPGRHDWRADAKYSKKIMLRKGSHPIELYHIHIASQGGIALCWTKPGSSQFVPIPPEAFPPVPEGSPTDLEKAGPTGQPVLADFSVRWMGETFFADRYTYRYYFEAKLGKRRPPNTELLWELGDGTTTDKTAFDHVYLLSEPYTVTLTVKQGQKTEKLSCRIEATRNWTRVAEPTLDPIEDHARLVAEYSFASMPIRYLTVAMTLLERAKNPAARMKIAWLIVDSHKKADDEALIAAAAAIENDVLKSADGPDQAANAWSRVQARASKPVTRDHAAWRIGRIELDWLNRPQPAKDRFEGILKNPPAVKRLAREVQIALGDAWMALGDGEKARQAYQAAGTERPIAEYNTVIPPKVRAIEDFLRRKEFDAAQEKLAEWEWDFPEDKFGGYSTLLWVKLHQGRGEDKPAVRLASRLVAGNKMSPYAAELLMAAYQSYLKLDQKDRARECLRRIVEGYRESPQWAEAKKLYGQ